jgi:hypothetical protein
MLKVGALFIASFDHRAIGMPNFQAIITSFNDLFFEKSKDKNAFFQA